MRSPLASASRWWKTLLVPDKPKLNPYRLVPALIQLEDRRAPGDFAWTLMLLPGPTLGLRPAPIAPPVMSRVVASPPLDPNLVTSADNIPDVLSRLAGEPVPVPPRSDELTRHARPIADLMDDFWSHHGLGVRIGTPPDDGAAKRPPSGGAADVPSAPQRVTFSPASAAAAPPPTAQIGVSSLLLSGGSGSSAASGGSGGGPTIKLRAIDATASEFGDPSEAPGSVGSTGAFLFIRSDKGTTPLTVYYTVEATSTATAGSDYTTLFGSVIIPAGERSATALVQPLVDGVLNEPDETVTVSLLPDLAYTVDSTQKTDTVTISDFGPTTVWILADNPAMREEGGDATYTVYRDGDLTNALTVALTGSVGTQANMPPPTVAIPAGARSVSFSVSAIDDTDVEPFSTVNYAIAPGPYTISDIAASAPGYVFDSDVMPPGSGGGPVIMRLTSDDAEASEDGPDPATLNFSGEAGSYANFVGGTAGGQYRLVPPPGVTVSTLGDGEYLFSKANPMTVLVVPFDDTVGENEEFAVFELGSGGMNGDGGPHDVVLRVADNDPPLINVTVSDANSSEPGLSTGGYRISRGSAPIDRPVRVLFSATGTATPGKDYETLSSVTIPAGQLSVPLLVKPYDDTIPEPDESVELSVTWLPPPPPPSGSGGSGGSGGGTLPPPPAEVIIHDWDPLDIYRLTWDPLDGSDAEQTGNVQTRYPLDLDRSPGTAQGGDPSLVYNSDFVDPKPILHTVVPPDPDQPPDYLRAQVQWDQTGYGPEWVYLPGALANNEPITVGVQAPNPILTTGRHRWDLKLTLDYPDPTPDVIYEETGYEYVVSLDDSLFGAGWSFSGTDRLIDIPASGGPAGKLRVYGTGSWRFYEQLADGTYKSPAGDNGTLAAVAGGYEYTTPEGDKRTFNTLGVQTGWVSTDGHETLSYEYADVDGDLEADDLVGMTAIDGALTTFTYAGHLAGIDSATRSYSFTAGGQLTSADGPDADPTNYTYQPGTDLLSQEQTGAYFSNYQYRYGERWATGRGALVTTVYDPADTHGMPLRDGPLPAGLPAPPAGLQPAPKGPAFEQPPTELDPATPETGDPVGRVADAYWDRTDWTLDRRARPQLEQSPDGGRRIWDRDPDTTWVKSFDDEVRTPAGVQVRATLYARDGQGYVTGETLPDGNPRAYVYDPALHRLTRFTNERGLTTSYVYDAQGHQTKAYDELGHLTQAQWTAEGLLLSVTDPRSVTTSYAYDSYRRPTRVIEAYADPTGLQRTTTTVYDTATGEAAQVVSAQGYDADSTRLILTTSYGYDAAARPTSVVEAVGTSLQRSTLTAYDAAGRLLSVGTPQGYDSAPTRLTTSYAYDAAGQQTQVIEAFGDPLQRTTTTVYDAAGRVLSVTDPLQVVTSYGYDVANRQQTTLEAVGTPLQRTTTQTYSSDGELVRTDAPLGRGTTYAYDSRGRLAGTTEAVGTPDERSSQRAYFPTGELQRLTTGLAAGDAYAHPDTTLYQIDAAGRTVLVEEAAATFAVRDTRTDYDAVGQAVRVYQGAPADVAAVQAGTATDAQKQAAHVASYSYDALGRQTAIRQADQFSDAEAVSLLGHARPITTLQYDAADNLIGQTDPRGVGTSFSYDALNRPTSTTEAATVPAGVAAPTAGARTTSRAYDAADNVTQTTDTRGAISTFSYDILNRVQEITEAANRPEWRRTTYAYDAADRLKEQTAGIADPTRQNLRVASYSYDALGRLEWTEEAANATLGDLGHEPPKTQRVYDTADRLQAVVDPLSHRTTYNYDALDRVTSVTDPLGHIINTSHDAADNTITITDSLSRITTFGYDPLNRLVAIQDPLNAITTIGYDSFDQRVRSTDARGFTTTTAYDALGRPASVSDPLQHLTSFGYDIAGNQIRVVDALNKTAATAFDALNQPIAAADALNHIITTVYDAAGNVQAAIDPLNHRTTYGYDAFNHQQTITDARNDTTTMLYDSAGNTVEVQDASGNRTLMSYDALNRLRSRLDPQSKQTVYAYDADSRLVGVTDRLNRQRVYNYDDADRRTGETWKDAAGTVAQLLTYTYDAADQMLSASNAAGVYSFGYDLAGRVQTVAEPYNLSLTFTYDAAGERTQVADSFGGVTTSVYDDAGRLTSRQLGGAVAAPARVDYGYSNRNELTDVTRYSDLAGTTKVSTTSYSYDDAGRLSNIQHNNASGGGLANYTYTYDSADRLSAKIDNGVTTPYNYYDDNQLQQDGAATYSYDATGNRTNPGYTTGPDNRITSDGTWTYSYDDEGNTTKKSKGAGAETWTYGYDNANRMIWSEQRSSDGGPLLARVEYTYDVFGNRIRRVQYDGAMTVVSDQRFGYDGWDTAKPDAIGNENFEVYVDLDGGNNITARRLYGAGFDQPAARIDANGVAWYLTDRQGSVRAVTDSTGAITGTRDYSAFGAITLEVGTGLDRYAYTAREWDGLLRLQYNHDRLYDPDTGRFTSEDPRDADHANSYRYTGNSPTNATDPSGLADLKFYRSPNENYTSVHGSDTRNLFGWLVIVRGHSYVARRVGKEWRYLPLSYVAENEGRLRFYGNTDPSRANNYHKLSWMGGGGAAYDRDLAAEWTSSGSLGREQLFGPKPAAPTNPPPGEPDILDFRGLRMADFPTLTQPSVRVGAAGAIAAATIVAMMKHVAASAGEELVLNYTGTKLLQFGHFLAKRGWRMVLNSSDELVDVVTAEGTTVSRKEWATVVEGFEKELTAGEMKALGAGTPTRWGVDPTMRAADETAKVIVNGSYIKNPTARSLTDLLKNGKVGGKEMSGRFMYVVDEAGNITIGTRAGQRMPHPTLIGGENPTVRAAGIVDIRGGRIYSVDSASGHFKLGVNSLDAARDAFGKLPDSAFHKDFHGYLDHTGTPILGK